MAKTLLISCFLLTYASAIVTSTTTKAEPPAVRKLGGQWLSADAPENVRDDETMVEWSIQGGQAPSSTDHDQHSVEMVRRGHHHSTVDKSVAGGGVIICGLATTFLVAVFCYIRATRRHKAGEENESTPPTV